MKIFGNKTLVFLGDSITAGSGASRDDLSYVKLVEKALECKVVSKGVGGTRIAKQTNKSKDPTYDNHFITRVSNEKEGDFIFVFGGTNDYGHGDALMGKPTNCDDSTFFGAINQLIDKLCLIYGKDNICFILPIPRFQDESVHGEGAKKRALYCLADYVEAEKTALTLKGIDYLDISDKFIKPETVMASAHFADGIHPNDEGHKIIAESICKYLELKFKE